MILVECIQRSGVTAGRPQRRKRRRKKVDGCISVHRSVRLPDGLPIALPDSAHITFFCLQSSNSGKMKRKTKALGAKKTNRSAYLHPVCLNVCNEFRVSVFVFVQVCVCVCAVTRVCVNACSVCVGGRGGSCRGAVIGGGRGAATQTTSPAS